MDWPVTFETGVPDLVQNSKDEEGFGGQSVKHNSFKYFFRRALVGERLNKWLKLVSMVVPVTLNENKDKFLWRLGKNGPFSTQSLYKEIVKPEKAGGKDLFWKAKLPLKIKIPLWYLIKKGVLLRKDNLLKRGRKGDVTVVFVVLKR